MTDRDLLTLAAKAAGINLAWSSTNEVSPRDAATWNYFNPLTDDGDALRLAVKLVIDLQPPRTVDDAAKAAALYGGSDVYEGEQADPFANTRRAIVRAAAELGGAKK